MAELLLTGVRELYVSYNLYKCRLNEYCGQINVHFTSNTRSVREIKSRVTVIAVHTINFSQNFQYI